jgi:hypothetical protein
VSWDALEACDHIRSPDDAWSEREAPSKEVGESDALPIEKCPSPPVSQLNAGNRLAADARDFPLCPPMPSPRAFVVNDAVVVMIIVRVTTAID